MTKLETNKLKQITGGEITVWGCVIVAAIIVFAAGVIKGYTNPESCNSNG